MYDIILLFAAELEEPKIAISGKGLKNMVGKGENASTSLVWVKVKNLSLQQVLNRGCMINCEIKIQPPPQKKKKK